MDRQVRTVQVVLACCLLVLVVPVIAGLLYARHVIRVVKENHHQEAIEYQCVERMQGLAWALTLLPQTRPPSGGRPVERATSPIPGGISGNVYQEGRGLVLLFQGEGSRHSFAFNARLSGRRLKDLKSPKPVVVLFESDGADQAPGDISLLPVPPRHQGGSDHYVVLLEGKLQTRGLGRESVAREFAWDGSSEGGQPGRK